MLSLRRRLGSRLRDRLRRRLRDRLRDRLGYRLRRRLRYRLRSVFSGDSGLNAALGRSRSCLGLGHRGSFTGLFRVRVHIQ